jgi:hypothetical protein
MALAKAKILVDRTGKNKFDEQITVLFNPGQYSIESSNKYAWNTIQGLSMPLGQFVSGESDTLTMELFFDSYEARTDVRAYTSQITGLLTVDKDLHAPPVCKFAWDKLSFKGIVEKVSQKFTMFLDTGAPVRATLSVTFKAWKSKSEQLMENPRQSADRTKQKMLKQGEQLWMLASDEYENPRLWRNIANANGIDNPRILQSGKKIVVPRLE